MKEEQRVDDYLRDMLEYSTKARRILGMMSYEDFIADEKTNLAIFRAVEVIGEAARHVPATFRKKHSEIPWRDICGMRDQLIHNYRGINYRLVWNTVRENLPILETQLRHILGEN